MTLAAKDADERQRRILQASLAVLRVRGFAGTRLADIAAIADTSPSLILYHFPSLTDLLIAALQSVEDDFFAELGQLSAEVDPRDRLVTMVRRAAEGGPAFGDWQLWLEVWVQGRQDKRVRTLQRSSEKRWRDELHAVIAAGIQQGAFREVHPDEATIRLSSLLDGLAVQVVVGGAGLTPEDVVRIWLGGAERELGLHQQELVARVPD